jgi:hypothetical protein
LPNSQFILCHIDTPFPTHIHKQNKNIITMKAYSIIYFALLYVMTAFTASAVPIVFVRMNVPPSNNVSSSISGEINAATRDSLNFYANYATKEYMAEVAKTNSTRLRHLRGSHDDYIRHLLSCAQCTQQHTYFWCQTYKYCLRRHLALTQFLASGATTIPTTTTSPMTGYTNCRQLPSAQGISNATNYATKENFASFASNLAPNQAGLTVIICDDK